MAKIKLLQSKQEAGNIKTFAFETKGASWLPGQYAQYTLEQVAGDEKAKKHYFTLASAPSEGEIHISTRISDSPFKQALNSLQPGEEIDIQGIEGEFTWEDDKPVVLIAGGIGVTPYRSILLARAKQGASLNAHLLYFGRDENFAFRREFDQLASEHAELRIDYLVGHAITADSILDLAPEARERTTYISGPESMVDTIGEDLANKGVSLKQDWFPGYDESSY